MKRQDVIFMLLPCLLLAGVAWWLRVRESPKQQAPRSVQAPSGPFTLVIKNIEKVPVNADEVADGYDTKVCFLLIHTGKTPARWGEDNVGTFFSDPRIVVQRNGKTVRLIDVEKPFKESRIGTHLYGFQKERNAYRNCYLLRLRDIPQSYGALTLETDWYLRPNGSGYSVVGAASFKRLRKAKVPRAEARLMVRQAGEVIKQPSASHDPQIVLKKTVVRPLTAREKWENTGCDTKVEFHLFYGGPVSQGGGALAINGSEVYLRDETGKEYPYNIIWTTERSDRETLRLKIVPYYINLQQVPKRNGKVTLHVQLQAGDNWPLPVQAVVRPVPSKS